MRTRLKLPRLDEIGSELDPDAYYVNVAEGFNAAARSARALARLKARRVPNTEKAAADNGRTIGNLSLKLVSQPVVETLAYGAQMTAEQIQAESRRLCLGLVTDARNLAASIGRYPSMAGLAHPDYRLSYYIRETSGSNDIVDALEAAQAKFRIKL